jgi:RNA polymerase sigma factor (TIGR02999 family)
VKEDPTTLLSRVADGDGVAAEHLMPLVYEELRALAGSHFRHQPADHTLQPTALVHEVYVRMIDQANASWRDRAHFFATCALAMRQILTDHARRRGALKRGGDRERVTLAAADGDGENLELVALDDILTRLGERNQRQARLVEYRFFGGLSVEEAACALGVSVTTAEKDWRVARAWLSAELAGDDT